MNLENMYDKPFSHIYIEEQLLNDHTNETARKIISKFTDAKIITIHHYKDVFNRRRQNVIAQHNRMNLIMADKKGRLIYDGSPVCQDFDEKYFYYTSLCMNCVYSCDYCYLKGIYPSGNLVIFCNIDDYFSQIRDILKEHPAYLCISYDTDLMAIEELTGYVKKWCEFTKDNQDLTIEIRTKSGNKAIFDDIEPCDRAIFAWTISPDKVIEKYEHKTANMDQRIMAAKTAMENGFPVRLCFDPMIYTRDWQDEYSSMVDKVSNTISMNSLRDISVGSFRISETYLKPMRKNMPDSAVIQYPYVNTNGFYQYDEELRMKMEKELEGMLVKYVDKDRIFHWK